MVTVLCQHCWVRVLRLSFALVKRPNNAQTPGMYLLCIQSAVLHILQYNKKVLVQTLHSPVHTSAGLVLLFVSYIMVSLYTVNLLQWCIYCSVTTQISAVVYCYTCSRPIVIGKIAKQKFHTEGSQNIFTNYFLNPRSFSSIKSFLQKNIASYISLQLNHFFHLQPHPPQIT